MLRYLVPSQSKYWKENYDCSSVSLQGQKFPPYFDESLECVCSFCDDTNIGFMKKNEPKMCCKLNNKWCQVDFEGEHIVIIMKRNYKYKLSRNGLYCKSSNVGETVGSSYSRSYVESQMGSHKGKQGHQ